MEKYYKLHRLRELADNDEDFILALAETFLEEVPADAALLKQAVENENMLQAYQTAHKMKPTVDVFELGVLDKLIEIQDWGKYKKEGEDVKPQLAIVLEAIEKASKEIKSDFSL
ncbi:Hpt domain-containing protein [Lacinutrix sp. MedPE-SW]|uniref:Hpt domain-containing protein n=1 Tax=Lacinutrix sp. MedPE-SW TaxID=1860087 RepID=UPI00091B2C50|nr:Hpt domain-containing protein [Lacinutrix sp. MedPE-SW]OIQ22772.1 MAG: Hpt domain-containing protein [Lacinutrix sp. MedPE-SW]